MEDGLNGDAFSRDMNKMHKVVWEEIEQLIQINMLNLMGLHKQVMARGVAANMTTKCKREDRAEQMVLVGIYQCQVLL